MKNLFKAAAAFFLKNQCPASSTHADQAPPTCKAIIKKRFERFNGKTVIMYHVELYVGNERVATFRLSTESEAKQQLDEIKANPDIFFFPEKIIDQVIFSNLA